jgi:Skp family chaperone for outer membrane proteins
MESVDLTQIRDTPAYIFSLTQEFKRACRVEIFKKVKAINPSSCTSHSLYQVTSKLPKRLKEEFQKQNTFLQKNVQGP